MKGLIFDIKRFAVHDGPGIRTTVFFKGCPLSCRWCHNPESRRSCPEKVIKYHSLNGRQIPVEEQVGEEMSVAQVIEILVKDRIFMEESAGGVTFSGGEPLLQPDFLLALAQQCKMSGMHTALDTTGYAGKEVLSRLIPHMDLFLFDLKHMDSEKHRKYAGVPNEKILENLFFLARKQAKVIIRFPLIPGINDDTVHLRSLVKFLTGLPSKINEIDVLPFHALAGHKYSKIGMVNRMQGIPEPTDDNIKSTAAFLRDSGFTVKVGG